MFKYITRVVWKNELLKLRNSRLKPKNEVQVKDFRETGKSGKVGWMKKLVDMAPSRVQPYLRLIRMDFPTGTWLIYWPCTWSIAMAAPPECLPDLYLLGVFGGGAVVMRGAACIINDLFDRDLDAKVARTSRRPLVDGSVTNQQAVVLLAAQLTVALLILLQLNWYSVCLGAASLLLTTVYPITKRFTYYPQVLLGLTLNWGVLLGSSAVHGQLDMPVCLPLYLATVAWTTIYDTIYAHQDISDDLLLGIKSTAIKFGHNTKCWLTGLSFIMTSALCTSGIMAQQTWLYYSAVSVVAGHLAWQIYGLRINVPDDCAKRFKSNHHIGIILFGGIVLGNLMKEQTPQETNNCIVVIN